MIPVKGIIKHQMLEPGALLRVAFVKELLTAGSTMECNRKLLPTPPSKGPNLNLQLRNSITWPNVIVKAMPCHYRAEKGGILEMDKQDQEAVKRRTTPKWKAEGEVEVKKKE